MRGHLADWQLELDGPVLCGYTAIVVPVRQASEPRERRMLKIRWLDASTEQEPLALRIWDGRGAVRLMEDDPATGAMLLERLDPDRTLMDVSERAAVDVAADLLRRLAVPAPGNVRSISREVADMAEDLPRRWELAGRPISRARLDRLLGLAEELSRTDARMMVNHDLHYENVLAGTREPWLAIDPKIVAGDLEYAVAQLLWNRTGDLADPRDVEERLERIADRAGLDVERARLWSVIRLAEAWIWSLSVDRAGSGLDACRRLLGWLDWASIADA